jgi:glutamate synthase domain-containing protein 1
MCGIIGYLDKRGGQSKPLGKTLLAMLQALSCRGPDSAGVAIYGLADASRLRVSVPPGTAADKVVAALLEAGAAEYRDYHNGVYDASLLSADTIDNIEDSILQALPKAEVICLGKRLNLFKQVGSPQRLEATYHISRLIGTHGIGHTRLSTESKVDLSHSQPFWAHGVPDLATVHNGHVTNYHKLRRQYEQRCYRFYTENDSEVIGVYLRDRMAHGLSFTDALCSSLDDFDGSFSYLAATTDSLAYVRDRFGFKPLIVAETADFVAIATEEIAIRQALGQDFVAREPAPGTMKVWTTPQSAAVAAS